ncbi:DUF4429 domain-containing protein [Streptomyces sp. NPDC088116]|uniref:DUF4429 domain-containing protein n=1 Tax=Streptomyces sp. NPDC088116 TaxID=3365825 RepID=UPI0037FC814F
MRRALSDRPIPIQAIADAVLGFPGSNAKWGTLRIIPRSGVDAVAEVLGDQLPESEDPYLIRFPTQSAPGKPSTYTECWCRPFMLLLLPATAPGCWSLCRLHRGCYGGFRAGRNSTSCTSVSSNRPRWP